MKNKITKIIYCILLSSMCFLLCNCFLIRSYTGESRAKKGDTINIYSGFSANTDDLKKALIVSLRERSWNITYNQGNTVIANKNYKNQNAKINCTIYDSKLVIDTKGSTVFGRPYIPERYLNFLMKSVRKNLNVFIYAQ